MPDRARRLTPGAPLSQLFLNQEFGDKPLEPRDEPALPEQIVSILRCNQGGRLLERVIHREIRTATFWSLIKRRAGGGSEPRRSHAR